ncbi:MAG: thioredoxin TrxC [Deferrisomatales bacterium]|nr:thioredoxin TrxC [Deferrisomatales bacterium]
MSELVQVVCPHCTATNRVPAARLKDAPNCGRCKGKLFTSRPLELNATTFDKHVGNSGIPVLVDFWAPWCGPCKQMAPVFSQAAVRLEPRVRVAKVNTEAEQALAARFRVQSIPTLALFRGGRETARQAGAQPLESLLQWVESRI